MASVNETEEEDIIKLSVSDLQKATDVYFKNSNTPTREIWKTYITRMFVGIPNVTLDLDNKDHVYSTEEDMEYLHKIAFILSKTPDVIVELYTWWIAVQSMIINTTTDMFQYISRETASTKSYSVARLK